MRDPYYEATQEREYIIINNKPVNTIHLEVGKPRIRITLDESKWKVLSHLADSGSTQSITIIPKALAEKENMKNEKET